MHESIKSRELKNSKDDYHKISLLMNSPGVGHPEISGAKKTNFLRTLEETGYLAYHRFKKLGLLQAAIVQGKSLRARFSVDLCPSTAASTVPGWSATAGTARQTLPLVKGEGLICWLSLSPTLAFRDFVGEAYSGGV